MSIPQAIPILQTSKYIQNLKNLKIEFVFNKKGRIICSIQKNIVPLHSLLQIHKAETFASLVKIR